MDRPVVHLILANHSMAIVSVDTLTVMDMSLVK